LVKRSAKTFTVSGQPRIDGFLRGALDLSWGKARALVEQGKVFVDGERILDTAAPLRDGQSVEVNERAPRPTARVPDDLIVYVDAHVVVVRKPAGISTVPFEDDEKGTLDELVRRAIEKKFPMKGSRPNLGVVHRLDKETSGLVVFTRTWLAKKSLSSQFRAHTTERRYLAIAHGVVPKRTITSNLVANRGDGLRGSGRGEGQRAVTHVEPIESLLGADGTVAATLISVNLGTGRTHQIRIHLSEMGHPILGERVYIRNFRGSILPAPRVMLHATELGFTHPATERPVHWEEKPPKDFLETLERLRS
jgi:23S rRNA pseudouridine1911/1915/1917 synthase